MKSIPYRVMVYLGISMLFCGVILLISYRTDDRAVLLGAALIFLVLGVVISLSLWQQKACPLKPPQQPETLKEDETASEMPRQFLSIEDEGSPAGAPTEMAANRPDSPSNDEPDVSQEALSQDRQANDLASLPKRSGRPAAYIVNENNVTASIPEIFQNENDKHRLSPFHRSTRVDEIIDEADLLIEMPEHKLSIIDGGRPRLSPFHKSTRLDEIMDQEALEGQTSELPFSINDGSLHHLSPLNKNDRQDVMAIQDDLTVQTQEESGSITDEDITAPDSIDTLKESLRSSVYNMYSEESALDEAVTGWDGDTAGLTEEDQASNEPSSNIQDIRHLMPVGPISEPARQNDSKQYEQIRAKVLLSMDKAKMVEQISGLAQDVVGMADQINLLAINAVIEATRAGESGSQFVDVAREMKKLAYFSSATVSQLYGLSQQVEDAINDLVNNTNELLGFINDDVLNDYSRMQDISRQYQTDADLLIHLAETISGNVKKAIHDSTAEAEGSWNQLSTL